MDLKKLRHTHATCIRLSKNALGFTLIELMVVVAIIGLLAAVAIPQFKKYQAKARTSEAKLALASIYTAMESYNAEYGHFFSCLAFAGYAPTGAYTDRNYTVGFSDMTSANSTTPAACSAGAGSYHMYSGAKGAPTLAYTDKTNLRITSAGAVAQIQTSYGSYTAAAVGMIDKDYSIAATIDRWWINDSKAMTQSVVGY